jgi:hypothetical protein
VKAFDLLEDSGRIYAAFLQVYGINLRKAGSTGGSFASCSKDSRMKGRSFRRHRHSSREYSKHMTPAERNNLARLKEYYQLEEAPDVMTGLFDSLLGIAE